MNIHSHGKMMFALLHYQLGQAVGPYRLANNKGMKSIVRTDLGRYSASIWHMAPYGTWNKSFRSRRVIPFRLLSRTRVPYKILTAPLNDLLLLFSPNDFIP
jgi:hypothetical protein